MEINMIGSFIRNAPFGTEIAFAKGLRQLGVKVNTWDPSREDFDISMFDGSEDATIVFKDHGEKTYRVLNNLRYCHPVIEYQPDDIRAPGIRGMMQDMRQYCDYAFTFDDTGAKVAKEELGYKKTMKLLVTADPELYRPLNLEKEFDFCFVGSLSNPVMHKSRREMIEILVEAGYRVEYLDGLFDPHAVNRIYNRSKIVLNHATDVGQLFGYGYGFQCRHFEAAMSGACLLSNSMSLHEPDGLKQFCTFRSKEDLLEAAESVLNTWYDGYVWMEQGTRFYNEVMTSHQPVHRAQQIVDFIESVKS